MPQDTIWLDNSESFTVFNRSDTSVRNIDSLIIENLLGIDSIYESNSTYSYNSKNDAHADSIVRILMNHQHSSNEESFKEKEIYYDKIGNILEFFILLGAIALGVYAYRRAEKYKANPFDEDERDWVEIGSSPRNNYGQSSNDDSIVYSKPAPKPLKEYLTYNGWDLKFDEAQIIAVLQKRFAYFNALGMIGQKRFLTRHKKFMRSKIFKIHTYNGFKEMPILISATAIQLSFGLDEFMLPFYQYIHIFPQEFLGMHPTMRFLEGNVSGNSINISWKHYLEGYEKKSDGQNLGLHEMAHAYYAQNFTFDGEKDKCFINGFSTYNTCGNKIFEAEKILSGNLFSDYALKNFQEFWAESVEIFFERPAEMKEQYRDLYDSMSLLLNQTPV
jgi:MtfA peptidase